MESYYSHYYKLLSIAGSEGKARSALMMFCFIKEFGWPAAKQIFTKATFYRNRRLLLSAGLDFYLPEPNRVV